MALESAAPSTGEIVARPEKASFSLSKAIACPSLLRTSLFVFFSCPSIVFENSVVSAVICAKSPGISRD